MQDDAHWLERYQQLWTQHHDKQVTTRELVSSVLSVSEHWEQDLTLVNGLADQVVDLDAILSKGMRDAVNRSANHNARRWPGFFYRLLFSYNIPYAIF